jgi:hypothetical protein
MADGLLSGILGVIDRQKQATKAGLGLLVNDPMEFARNATARYFPTKEEERQYAAVKQAGGDITQTPYYQKIFNLAQFQGSMKQIPKTQYELAQEVAQKNATEMLGLPPNNTAMDRARALGFETAPSKELYHAARGDWETSIVNPAKSDLGFHVGTLEQAENRAKAFGYGGVNYGDEMNIMPLLKSKYANFLPLKDTGSFHADAIAKQLEKKKLLARGKGKQIEKAINEDWKLRKQFDQQMRDVLEQANYQGIKYKNQQEGEGTSYAFTDPSMVRSRFAAFDPARANEPDLLAAGIPFGLLGSTQVDLPKKQEKKPKK